MGRGGGGGGGRGGGSSGGGSRGGSYRSSSSGGRGSSSFSSSGRSHYYSSRGYHQIGNSGWYTNFDVRSKFDWAVVIICVAAILLGYLFQYMPARITPSTIAREALDKKYVDMSTDWYDDSDMHWIASPGTLKDGLRYFYDKTGVQPYLVIVEDINGDLAPSGDEVWEYGNEIYDEMFTDEGHMVFVFQCPDGGTNYMMAAVTGVQAKTVVDDEALEILYDYLDAYFYSDRDEDEMFADAFRDAADRMMKKTTPIILIIVLAVAFVVVVFIAYLALKAYFKRKKEEAEETERILNTPISQLGEDDYD